MSELEALLDQLLGREMEHAGESTGGKAWANLEDTGLTRVGIAEELGGCGGERRDAAAVVTRCGEAALGVPLTEGLLVAGHLAALAGEALPPGVVIAAVLPEDGCSPGDGGTRLAGDVTAVPWGAAADEVWLLARPRDGADLCLVRLVRGEWTAIKGRNLAGEPRDCLTVDLLVPDSRVRPLPDGAAEDVRLLAAFGRSCQMLGALRAALRLTHEYTVLRQQFGKPLTAHQAVRHTLADMACEVAAAETAVAHALGRLPGPGEPCDTEAAVAVAAAKARVSEAATVVARAAHQLHGAVGMTAEHPLHHFTTRLWSWQDECGSADYWSRRVAGLVRTGYAGDLWAALVSQSLPAH